MSAPQCQALVDQLSSYAPLLRPRICPKSFEDNCLISFCKTNEQKEKLSATLSTLNNDTQTCTLCHSKGITH